MDSPLNVYQNYDSAGKGGNRFATILMYMTDLGPDDGGETVFPKGWPSDVAEEDRMDTKAVSFAICCLLIYFMMYAFDLTYHSHPRSNPR